MPNAPGWAAASTRLDSLFIERRRSGSIPGMAGGIVCGDTLVWARGYGVYALDDPRRVTRDTRFRIASLTKLFTASAVLQLAQQGSLSLADPVKRHLSWFDIRRPEATGTEPITIRQLLTHTSGLPRDSRLTDFDRLFQPRRGDAIATLPGQTLESPPGESVAYSNLGYAVLGEVIRAASGRTYQSYVEENLLEPLGMEETLMHPAYLDDTAWGHGPLDSAGNREKAGFWELRFATPAGGMASSVRDIGRFMVAELAPYLGREPAILSRENVRAMHQIHAVVDSARGGMGLGWAVEVSAGQHVVYHGGELPEQTSFLLLDLEGLIGVIVLTNAQDADANGTAQEALRMVRQMILKPGLRVPVEAIPSG